MCGGRWTTGRCEVSSIHGICTYLSSKLGMRHAKCVIMTVKFDIHLNTLHVNGFSVTIMHPTSLNPLFGLQNLSLPPSPSPSHSMQGKGYTRGVTKPQFGRLLHFLSIQVSPEDLKLIERKFESPVRECGCQERGRISCTVHCSLSLL